MSSLSLTRSRSTRS